MPNTGCRENYKTISPPVNGGKIFKIFVINTE